MRDLIDGSIVAMPCAVFAGASSEALPDPYSIRPDGDPRPIYFGESRDDLLSAIEDCYEGADIMVHFRSFDAATNHTSGSKTSVPSKAL